MDYSWLNTFNLSETLLTILKSSCYIHKEQPANYNILLQPSNADINTYELDVKNGLLYHFHYYILINGNKEMIGSKWKHSGNKFIRIDKKYSYEEIAMWELKNECKMPTSLKNHLLNVSVIVNNNVFNIYSYNEQLKIPFSKIFNQNNCYKYSSEENTEEYLNGSIHLGGDSSGNYNWHILN